MGLDIKPPMSQGPIVRSDNQSESDALNEERSQPQEGSAAEGNTASTLLDAGRYSEAVMAYERYLSDPDAPRADEARAAMERAKAKLGGQEPTITGVVDYVPRLPPGITRSGGSQSYRMEGGEKLCQMESDLPDRGPFRRLLLQM
jgi:hypothetical protein